MNNCDYSLGCLVAFYDPVHNDIRTYRTKKECKYCGCLLRKRQHCKCEKDLRALKRQESRHKQQEKAYGKPKEVLV